MFFVLMMELPKDQRRLHRRNPSRVGRDFVSLLKKVK